MKLSMRAWSCLLALVLSWGCAGALDDRDRFDFLLDAGDEPDAMAPPDASGMSQDTGMSTDEPPACVTAVLQTSCNGPACHGAGSLLLDLLSPGVAERLVDEPALSAGECDGRVYVETGGRSLLLDKLAEEPSCGVRMPYGLAMLEASQIECVRAWVIALGGSGDP